MNKYGEGNILHYRQIPLTQLEGNENIKSTSGEHHYNTKDLPKNAEISGQKFEENRIVCSSKTLLASLQVKNLVITKRKIVTLQVEKFDRHNLNQK